jgi:hypothetical protein
VVGEVTTLEHEFRDNTVERTTLVTETLFTSTQGTEVFSSLRDNVSSQFHNNTLHDHFSYLREYMFDEVYFTPRGLLLAETSKKTLGLDIM